MTDPTPWKSLTAGVLGILKDSARDLIDVEKPEIATALAEIAEEYAKQSWLIVSGNDDEKAQAPGNIRSLRAQGILVASDAVIVGVTHALEAFGKILDTVENFLIQYGPALIAAIPK